MNYELAKKLNDAGFPNIKLCIGKGKPGHYDKGCDEKLPTLEELIKACVNKEEFALFYYPPSRLISEDACWSAEYGNKSSSLSLGEVGGDYSANGSTPEEAMANLWLELNKKDI